MGEHRSLLVQDAITGTKYYAFTGIETVLAPVPHSPTGSLEVELCHNQGPIYIPEEMHLGIAYPSIEDVINVMEAVEISIQFAAMDPSYLERRPQDDPDFGMDIPTQKERLRYLFQDFLIGRIDAGTLHFLSCDYDKLLRNLDHLMGQGIIDRSLRYIKKVGRNAILTRRNDLIIYNREYHMTDIQERVHQVEGPEIMRSLFLDFLRLSGEEDIFSDHHLFRSTMMNNWCRLLLCYYDAVDDAIHGGTNQDFLLGDLEWAKSPLCEEITKRMLPLVMNGHAEE